MNKLIWVGNGLLYVGAIVGCLWLRRKLDEARQQPNRTWRQIMEQPPKSQQERVIVQMTCALSVQDRYAHMTPDEIYQKFVDESRLITAGDPQLKEMERQSL